MELPSNLAAAVEAQQLQKVSCACLSASARSKITFPLKQNQDGMYSSSDHLKDWRGFAENIGLSPEEVDDINSKVNINYADEVFKKWPLKGDYTIGKLVEILTTLERYDILEDASIIRKLVADALKYNQEMDIDKEENECRMIRSSPPTRLMASDLHLGRQINMSNTIPDYRLDESSSIVTDDVIYHQRTLFDAFVCYVEDDMKFVRRMMQKLESGKDALKLCVEARDLLGGQAELNVTAQLIQQRCKKVIIVLSPKFLQSEVCDFQLKFAHHLSPGAKQKRLVPVVIGKDLSEKDFPLQLTFVTKLYYDRPDTQEWFWNRLKYSVRADLEEIQEDSDNWGTANPGNADPDTVSICADRLPCGSLLRYPPSNDSSSDENSDSDSSGSLESLTKSDSEQPKPSNSKKCSSSSPSHNKSPPSCPSSSPGEDLPSVDTEPPPSGDSLPSGSDSGICDSENSCQSPSSSGQSTKSRKQFKDRFKLKKIKSMLKKKS